MRAVVQRVSHASVTVDDIVVSSIQTGLLVLLGVTEDDTIEDIEWLSGKISRLRIFEDDNGIMNKNVMEVGGDAIVVSQFTLYASTKKGNRPGYSNAAKPEIASPLYEQFVHRLERDLNKSVGTGVFGADMKVTLLNDGPITICFDTKNKE